MGHKHEGEASNLQKSVLQHTVPTEFNFDLLLH